jgi:hypothetical protein
MKLKHKAVSRQQRLLCLPFCFAMLLRDTVAITTEEDGELQGQRGRKEREEIGSVNKLGCPYHAIFYVVYVPRQASQRPRRSDTCSPGDTGSMRQVWGIDPQQWGGELEKAREGYTIKARQRRGDGSRWKNSCQIIRAEDCLVVKFRREFLVCAQAWDAVCEACAVPVHLCHSRPRAPRILSRWGLGGGLNGA